MGNANRKKKKYAINLLLKVLLVTNALVILAGAALGPILALYVEDLGGDLLAASSAAGVYAIFAGLTIYVVSKWEDRVNHQERLVIIGYLIMAAAFIGYIFVNNPLELFIIQMFIGLGEAVYLPAYDALYSKHLDENQEASEWGIWESMAYIVSAAGAMGGGLVVTYYGFPTLFILMSFVTILSAIGMFVLFKNSRVVASS